MRIVLLTAGTGSFYCGTCMRDNALIAALRRQGHDALLVPLYLPLMLDEAPATDDAPLFYGGINVYLQQKSGLFRKTPRWIDRLLDAPGMLKAAAKRAGSTQADRLGDLTLSVLRGEEGRQVKELERLVDWLASEGESVKREALSASPRTTHHSTPRQPVDVVCLSNILLIGLTRRIKERTGAAVVCTLQGEDSFLDSLPEPDRTAAWETLAERAADVDAFIGVSRYYSDVMRERAKLPADRLHVVHNGILLDGYGVSDGVVSGSPSQNYSPLPTLHSPALGYLARMCPPKGLETLVDAYILLRKRDRIKSLKLRAAGSMTTTDRVFVARLTQRLTAEGLTVSESGHPNPQMSADNLCRSVSSADSQSDVVFFPNLSRDEKIAFLQSLSVLSVPATYGESFGLYVIEALAAGVPVVQPRHAAFPELIEATSGGLLCEPNDPHALAETMEELLCDPDRARAMGEQGRQAVREKFSVEAMAQGVLRVFEGVIR